MALGIFAKTKVCCVIGDPIEHSMSPAVQNAALAEAGIDAVYVAFKVRKEECKRALGGMRALGILGANVTVPDKVEALACVDELDALAEWIGAVNTIKNDNGKLIGFNTDGLGALNALGESGTETRGKRILVIGAGGAAKAVALTLAKEGRVSEIVIANRTRENAKELAREVEDKTRVKTRFFGLGEGELKKAVGMSDILVNCTSVGMSPNSRETPVPKNLLRRELTVFDIVYNPLETRLLREAREVGCKTVSGDSMLVHQGAKAFEIWFGRKPDVGVMREAMLGELKKKK
jgi:shikimate dehydrogenase